MKKPGTEKEDKGRELLKKAAELIEEQPEPAVPQEKAPESKPRSGLSEKRKRALINYMAILFAVAFLLVALSLAIQYRDSQATISQLGANARSAMDKAETLQDENQKLSQDLSDAQMPWPSPPRSCRMCRMPWQTWKMPMNPSRVPIPS